MTVGPRFTGSSQASETVARLVTQMSLPPEPPGQLEPKKSVRPSAEMHEVNSQYAELTGRPQFTGVPQGSSVVSRVDTHTSHAPRAG